MIAVITYEATIKFELDPQNGKFIEHPVRINLSKERGVEELGNFTPKGLVLKAKEIHQYNEGKLEIARRIFQTTQKFGEETEKTIFLTQKRIVTKN